MDHKTNVGNMQTESCGRNSNTSMSELPQTEDHISVESHMHDQRSSMEVGPAGDFKIPYSTTKSNVEFNRMDMSHEDKDTHQSSPNNDGTVSKSLRSVIPGQSEVSFESVLKDAANDLKSGCIQWTHVFKESEDFENFCPNRVDKLLAEAKSLEENLLQQKEQLMQRLKALSRTLKMD